MSVYLRTKFQVSSIIPTRFSQAGGKGGGIILIPFTLEQTPKKLTQISVDEFFGEFIAILSDFREVNVAYFITKFILLELFVVYVV